MLLGKKCKGIVKQIIKTSVIEYINEVILIKFFSLWRYSKIRHCLAVHGMWFLEEWNQKTYLGILGKHGMCIVLIVKAYQITLRDFRELSSCIQKVVKELRWTGWRGIFMESGRPSGWLNAKVNLPGVIQHHFSLRNSPY